MEEELRRKVVDALRQACLPDPKPDIRLEETGAEHLGGSVISTRFEEMAPSARQDVIWQQLDKALSPPERSRITFIVAETKEEHDELSDANAS